MVYGVYLDSHTQQKVTPVIPVRRSLHFNCVHVCVYLYMYICTDIHKFPIQYDWNNHRNKRLLIARCVALCCWYYYIISSIKEKILPLFQDVCIYYGSLIMIQQVKICMRVLLQLIAGYSISLVALIISKLLVFLFVTFLFLCCQMSYTPPPASSACF